VAVNYRPPRPSELADCALVWYSAVDDYMARLGRPLPTPYLDPLLTLLRHLLTTDPERFLVAVRPGQAGIGQTGEQIVGFGIAAQREHVWFLSQLYVLPQHQGQGIGRALLTQILPSLAPARSDGPDGNNGPNDGAQTAANAAPTAPAADAADAETAPEDAERHPGVLAMCTDSAQPVSNALYARFGIVPRAPVFNLVGTPNPAALARLPAGIEAVPFGKSDPSAAIDTVDRAVLGYAHAPDHAYLRATGRTGFVYRADDATLLGYGYSSEAGRFGPVALLDDTLTAPVLGHLMNAIRPRGATTIWVPGANDRAMVALLRAGLRIEGFPALLCWSRPFGDFERYLPASLALL
jgi:GNAT superfamily N-acetyltransferase